jgi:hypothetical protein
MNRLNQPHPAAHEGANDVRVDAPDWGRVAASLLADLSCIESNALRGDPHNGTSPGDAVYHGWVRPDGQAAIVVEDRPGLYRPLPQLIRHSPAGMAWGYSGNGPRDLARSLLADALGTCALCPVCTEVATRLKHTGPKGGGGSNQANATTTRPYAACSNHCDAGVLLLPHLAFTEQVVARLPQNITWSLLRVDILRWLAGPRQPAPHQAEAYGLASTEPAQCRARRRRTRLARTPGQRP